VSRKASKSKSEEQLTVLVFASGFALWTDQAGACVAFHQQSIPL